MRRAAWLVLAAGAAWAGPPWGMKDLESASGESWVQVLEHCEDIPPSERTERWRTLVGIAAASALSIYPAQEQPFWAAERARELATRYPFLAKDVEFPHAREKAIQRDLEACVDAKHEDCPERLEVHADALTPAGALAAARVLRRGFVAAVSIPLVARAVRGQAALCGDPLTREVVLAALEQPREGKRATAARAVAFESCWSALAPALKKAQVGASKYLLANTCAELRARKALTPLQDDLCKDEEL